MSSKISALTAGAPAQNGDMIPVNRGGTNYSLLVSDINALTAGSAIFSPGGRLTLTSGVPVTTGDVAAAGFIYYTPYTHDYLMLYSGSAWAAVQYTERSLSLSGLTTAQPYDVFMYNNSGTATLEALAWTNSTTRATALAYQNGRLCKSGALTRLYLGTIQMSATSQCDDSASKRYVWNYYNRRTRFMKVVDTTDSWSYGTATWRQANGSAANQVNFVIGVAEDIANASVAGSINNAGSASCAVGVGLDATNTNSAQITPTALDAYRMTIVAQYKGIPAAGSHYLAWLEIASGATTFYGDNGLAYSQTGMVAEITA